MPNGQRLCFALTGLVLFGGLLTQGGTRSRGFALGCRLSGFQPFESEASRVGNYRRESAPDGPKLAELTRKPQRVTRPTMADPLIVKRPRSASPVAQIVVGVLILFPLMKLYISWRQETDIHSNNPALNLTMHVFLVVIPLIWAALLVYKPLQFEASAETQLGYSGYFSAIGADWWMSLMMWAAAAFASVVLGHNLITEYMPHPETLSTSPAMAAVTMGVSLVLGMVYGIMLRERPETRVSAEGLRNGLLNFYEWGNIHHISRHGAIYSIHHRANPALPASSFRLRDWESRAVLDRFLLQHSVSLSNVPQPLFLVVKLAVVVGFGLNLLLAFWLWARTSIDARWIVAVSFAVGILETVVLERLRGVSKYSKYKPVVEPQKNPAADS